MDPRVSSDNAGCRYDYEDSDGDMRLVESAPVV